MSGKCPITNTKFNNTVLQHVSKLRWAFQHNSELAPLFSFHLTRLKESGLIPKVLDEWLAEGKPKETEDRIFVEDPKSLVGQ